VRYGGQHSMLTRMSNFFRTLCTENYFKSPEFSLQPTTRVPGGFTCDPLTVLISLEWGVSFVS